jgi:hypothetical protein
LFRVTYYRLGLTVSSMRRRLLLRQTAPSFSELMYLTTILPQVRSKEGARDKRLHFILQVMTLPKQLYGTLARTTAVI